MAYHYFLFHRCLLHSDIDPLSHSGLSSPRLHSLRFHLSFLLFCFRALPRTPTLPPLRHLTYLNNCQLSAPRSASQGRVSVVCQWEVSGHCQWEVSRRCQWEVSGHCQWEVSRRCEWEVRRRCEWEVSRHCQLWGDRHAFLRHRSIADSFSLAL